MVRPIGPRDSARVSVAGPGEEDVGTTLRIRRTMSRESAVRCDCNERFMEPRCGPLLARFVRSALDVVTRCTRCRKIKEEEGGRAERPLTSFAQFTVALRGKKPCNYDCGYRVVVSCLF